MRVAGVDTVSKSFRVGDVNFIRELFVIDVYADMPPEDPEQDAVFAPPWSTLPWHLIVLMEEAIGRGWAAFSQAEAARLRNLPCSRPNEYAVFKMQWHDVGNGAESDEIEPAF